MHKHGPAIPRCGVCDCCPLVDKSMRGLDVITHMHGDCNYSVSYCVCGNGPMAMPPCVSAFPAMQ